MAFGFPAAVLSQVLPNKTVTKAQAAMDSMSEMPEVLVAPLFIESGGFTSRIVMVNELTFAITADVILFNRNGAVIASQNVAFQPHSQQALAVADMLRQANSTETVGPAEIHADPAKVVSMAIAAQLSITGSGISAGQHIEEEFVMVGTQGSGVLRSAGTALAGQPVIALKNTGATAQTATVACLTEKSGATQQQIQLSAGGSAVIQACSGSANPAAVGAIGDVLTPAAESLVARGAFGISVSGTGAPGSLSAFGFAWRGAPGRRVLSSQNFLLDAGLARSSNIVFTGVPIGAANALPGAAFTPEVAVSNFGSKAVNVTVLFARTDDSGPTATPVATASVPALSAKTIVLPPLVGDVGLRNSFVVQSDAAPGDFYASLVSVGSSGLDLVEQIGKDQLSDENAGSHPWSLASSSQDAMLLMFNHSAIAKYFNVKIGSGGVLWQQSWKLAPMETRLVSIRELIADQIKDSKGALLPKALDHGEISWFTANPGEGKGRLLQVDSAPQLLAGNIRLERNFSCGNYIVICGAMLDTSSISFLVGTDSDPLALGPVCPQLCTSYLNPDTCAGTAYGSCGSGYTYSWTSNDASIATLSGSSTSASATFFGAGVGTGSATGTVSSQHCSARAPGTPIVNSLQCLPSSVTRGSTVTCTLQGPGTASNWKFTSSSLGATVSSASGSTTTTWAGVMVDSGTITATATNGTSSTTVAASVTVNARSSGFTIGMPAMPTAASANGSNGMPTLTSPPVGSGAEDSFGQYYYGPAAPSFRTSPSVPSGPNQGYQYVTSFSDSSPFFYELNPALTNSSDPFYQAQYGRCGFPSVAQIVIGVQGHEYAYTPSHYSEIASALASNNPGKAAEAIVAIPTTTQNQFLANIQSIVNGIYGSAETAGQVQPPTYLPSGINFPAYLPPPSPTCN